MTSKRCGLRTRSMAAASACCRSASTLGIFSSHGIEHFIPEQHAVAQGVGFGDHGQMLAAAHHRHAKTETQDPFDATARMYGGLDRNFLGFTCRTRPPQMAYSPSEFSRMTTKSILGACARGEETP